MQNQNQCLISKKEFKAEKFFEDLKINWGQYLKSYLETWKSENI